MILFLCQSEKAEDAIEIITLLFSEFGFVCCMSEVGGTGQIIDAFKIIHSFTCLWIKRLSMVDMFVFPKLDCIFSVLPIKI